MGPRLRQSLLLISVSACALFSLSSTLLTQRSIPTRANWEAVVQELKGGLKEGDAVTWLPEWAEEGRVALKAVEGHTEVVYPPHHGPLDLARFKRVWVIGALGERGPELVARSQLTSEQRAALSQDFVIPEQPLELLGARERGRLHLSLVAPRGARVTADLFQDLSDPTRLTVSRQARLKSREERCQIWALSGWHCELNRSALMRTLGASPSLKSVKLSELSDQLKVERCLARPLKERLLTRSKSRALYSLDRRRHLSYVDCGLHPERHVSRDHRVIGGEPRRCVWLHPHEGKTLRLRWQTPLQAGAWLSLRYGWADLSVDPPFRRSGAKPLELSVSRGEASKPLWLKRITPGPGWNTERIDLPDDGRGSALIITLSAPEGVRDAQLCADLSARAPSVDAEREKP